MPVRYKVRHRSAYSWGIALGLMLVSVSQAVVINEFMASNVKTIADGQGQFDDWIELYNPSDAPVDVGGWYLTPLKI